MVTLILISESQTDLDALSSWMLGINSFFLINHVQEIIEFNPVQKHEKKLASDNYLFGL